MEVRVLNVTDHGLFVNLGDGLLMDFVYKGLLLGMGVLLSCRRIRAR
jgi:hypothetical protein